MEFNGLPEMSIEDITLEDIRNIAKKDAEFTNYKDVKKKNVTITLKP